MLRSFICRLIGHRIDRRRVWNDGIDFRTACARCVENLVRDQHGWREFDLERDTDANRSPHPREQQG